MQDAEVSRNRTHLPLENKKQNMFASRSKTCMLQEAKHVCFKKQNMYASRSRTHLPLENKKQNIFASENNLESTRVS